MASRDPLNIAEDPLSAKEAIDSDRVKNFCEVFVEQNKHYFFKPYIMNNPDPFFRDMPAHHSERIGKLREYWLREREKRASEDQSEIQLDESEAAEELSGDLQEFATTVANGATSPSEPNPEGDLSATQDP